MTDLTQPASAAEFMAAGVDEATATSLAAQHNTAAGRNGFNVMAEARETFRNQPPPPTPATPLPTTNAQLAEATAAHENAQLAGALDAVFAPPGQPYDYKFPESVEPPTDESMARDIAIKEALHRERLPGWAVTSILSNLAQDSRALDNETPAQKNARLDGATSRLSHMWGAAYEDNVAIVTKYLDELQKDPALRDEIRTARRAIVVNPLTMDTILQVAQHRVAKR